MAGKFPNHLLSTCQEQQHSSHHQAGPKENPLSMCSFPHLLQPVSPQPSASIPKLYPPSKCRQLSYSLARPKNSTGRKRTSTIHLNHRILAHIKLHVSITKSIITLLTSRTKTNLQCAKTPHYSINYYCSINTHPFLASPLKQV